MEYLHKHKEDFINAVNLASEYFHILPLIVEKDYYVTMILRLLVCAVLPNGVFLIAYRKTDEFAYFAGLLNRLTKGKVPVLRRWSGC